MLKRPLSLALTNAVIALWLVLTANLGFFQRLWQLTPQTGLMAGAFFAVNVLLLLLLLVLALNLLTWRWLARPVQGFILLAAALTAYFIDSFGTGIDRGQIQNLMETDWREARDLMTFHFGWRVTLFGLLPLFWLWMRPVHHEPFWPMLKAKLAWSGGSLALILALGLAFYGSFAPFYREHRELKNCMTPINSIGGLVSYLRKHYQPVARPVQPWGTDARRDPPPAGQKPTLLVLVVGETARAQSFGLNGSQPDTTPELARRGVVNYTQTSSCGTATAVSVPCLFSGMPRSDYDPDTAKTRQGLLDILQRAGYRVSWFDNNSGCKGACDRIENVPLLAERRPQWCRDNECQDGLLVDTLAQWLPVQPVQDRVVVLHQMGSHGPAYYRRYPDQFRRFTPTCDTNEIQKCERQHLINTYNNTILYTDHVLAQLIDQLAADPRYQSALWYVSDHGESTGEKGLYLHGAPYLFAPAEQTRVPMVTWLSADFKASHPRLDACLRAQATQPTSHDHLFHSLLGLLNVQTVVKNPALDLTATCSAAPQP